MASKTFEEYLRRGMCPNCKDKLIWDKEDEMYKCECGFNVDESDYDYYCSIAEIQQDDYDYHQDVDSNLSELNNLEI